MKLVDTNTIYLECLRREREARAEAQQRESKARHLQNSINTITRALVLQQSYLRLME